ncbi:acetyl-CoA carboxylase biotin carboxyl carrier protein [Bacillus sp. AGMB 02131]|uniref:Biotin carboxyl carrier protein of acetyl-CoA carboxylase n=1 Tax=Peribacillus faecalis TaxID=2772559 RepID=A0A927CVU7_9BACI|nr:acetyl-CoA carboxylase biotin carboxyl carrier protein [Peribacillus faecalis]
MGCSTLLKVQEIRELIKLVDSSSIQEFVYEQSGTKIEMKKSGGSVVVPQVSIPTPAAPTAATEVKPAAPAAEKATPAVQAEPAAKEEVKTVDENLHKVTSPMVGTFYQSPSPDAEAYVKVGSKVSDDDVVCIVEAMKLFNEITAEVKGEIVEILVKDGQLVEYGQPLFLVRAE